MPFSLLVSVLFFFHITFFYRLYTGGREGTSPLLSLLYPLCDDLELKNSAESDIGHISSKRGTVQL